MRKILIASHGNLAQGFKSAAKIIVGKEENIESINAYVEEVNLNEQIENYFSSLNPQDELVIFSDMFGGSVNQSLMQKLSRPNTHLITGTNLPVFLEILLTDDSEPLTSSAINSIISGSKEQLIHVNTMIDNTNNEDDFD